MIKEYSLRKNIHLANILMVGLGDNEDKNIFTSRIHSYVFWINKNLYSSGLGRMLRCAVLMKPRIFLTSRIFFLIFLRFGAVLMKTLVLRFVLIFFTSRIFFPKKEYSSGSGRCYGVRC